MAFRLVASRYNVIKARPHNFLTGNASPSRGLLSDVDPDMATHRTTASGLSERGFFVNNTELNGSVLLLPRSFLMWSPKSYEELTVESLSILSLLVPKIEILVIGSGSKARRPCPKLMKHFNEQGIKVEQMTSVRPETIHLSLPLSLFFCSIFTRCVCR
jgi:uncharacterized protein